MSRKDSSTPRVTMVTIAERTTYKAAILINGEVVHTFYGLTPEQIIFIENTLDHELNAHDLEKEVSECQL